jgi:DNA-binding response OmpR family regulator
MNGVAKILLLDQQSPQGELLQKGLTGAGFEIVCCAVAEELVKQAQDDGVSLVFCAFERVTAAALAQVKLIKLALTRLPVLVCCERFEEVIRLRFMEVGAEDLIPPEAAVQVARETLESLSQSDEPSAAKTVQLRRPAASEMYFQLHVGELSNALQFLCMTSRTGQLLLSLPDGRKGHIFIDNNTVTHAEFGDSKDVDAIAGLLAHGNIEARFFDGGKAPEVTSAKSVSQLLIEASVTADEALARQAQPPE